MVYITLEELKDTLPAIMNDWIDVGDESWEWIFNAIEQNCHVGKKSKKKKKKSNLDDIYARLAQLENRAFNECVDVRSIEAVNGKIVDIRNDIRRISNDITAAKSMAETAKQRTEFRYDKISTNLDDVSTKCTTCKHIHKQAGDQPCIGCCFNGTNISGTNNYEKKEDRDCKTCKYYCGEEAINEPCIACDAYQCWEAKSNG